MTLNKRTSLRQVFLFLMGLSLVYENFAIIIGGISFSYAMIILIPWFLCLINDLNKIGNTYHNYSFEINLLTIFLILIIILNIQNRSSAFDTSVFPETLFFNTLFFIFLLLDYSNHPQDVNAAIIGFAIGSMFVPILFYTGVGVEIDDSGRLVLFDNNSNVFGVRLVFAISIILHLFIIQDYFKLNVKKYWFILPLILLVVVVFSTGSRTAFICLVLVLLSTVFFYKGRNRFFMVFFGIIALIVFVYSLRGTMMYDRIMESVNSGDTSGRTDIWEAILPYCWEHPVFGVGMTGYDMLAVKAFGRWVNPHNVIVEIFAYSGLVGLSVYVVFWLKLLFQSIKLRKYFVYLPFILLLPIIVNLFCGHVIETKISYLVYAYVIFAYKNKYSQIK